MVGGSQVDMHFVFVSKTFNIFSEVLDNKGTDQVTAKPEVTTVLCQADHFGKTHRGCLA